LGNVRGSTMRLNNAMPRHRKYRKGKGKEVWAVR